MACEFPIMAFDTGVKSETGKRVFKYARPGTQFIALDALKEKVDVMPSKVKMINGHPFLTEPIPIPCGRCQACLMDYASELTTRAVLERRYWKNSYFVTLSYSDPCLPVKMSTGEAIVLKEDLQRFFARMRNDFTFRYMACGEYGDVTGRPHYHFILFTDVDLVLDQYGVNKFHARVISRNWPFGLHEVSIADAGCIAYVAGYVLKKAKALADNDDHRPFRLMSRHPGLGFRYLEDHNVLEDRFVYGDFGPGCKRRAVPGAFIRKLEDDGFDVSEFKEWNMINGRRFQQAMNCYYDTTDPDELGGLRRVAISDRFQKIRKEKI